MKRLAVLVFGMACCGTLYAQTAPAPAPAPAPAVETPPSAKDGAVLFSKSGCTFCHGPEGKGTDKAPNLREVRKRKSDEEIFNQIHDGGRMMPPFSDALSESEMRSLVMFLRAKDGWDLLPPVENAK